VNGASERPLRIIHSAAPVRICDNGGWSDTWFARTGRVFHIAVTPLTEVEVRVFPRASREHRFDIFAENYGERLALSEPRGNYGKHPLLEAALDYIPVPEEYALEVTIYSRAPAGCSTGTSASVSVALLGALARLSGKEWTPHDAAMAAHSVETQLLGLQSGIQDQLGAAYGWINLIDMYAYPHAHVHQLSLPDEVAWELEARLSLIYLGQSHNSSDVHRMVIRQLEAEGEMAPRLAPLRDCALEAAAALQRGDFAALGRSFVRNTEAQKALHPDLAGPFHRRVIEIAAEFQADGWKINGAGGAGGSVAILGPAQRSRQREMIRAILNSNKAFQSIPVDLAPRGLRIWETE